MTPIPDALLFLSTHCPHCPAVLQALGELVKAGTLGRLEVVNMEVHPEAGEALGVRSVPWVKIGPFELAGVRGREELARWAARAGDEAGLADGFHDLLKEGALAQVVAGVQQRPEALAALLPILANPEASINVRIGAGAVFEEMAGTPALQALVGPLGTLSAHADARVRADACHTLSLSRSTEARPFLRACLKDADAEVREIAEESLAELAGI